MRLPPDLPDPKPFLIELDDDRFIVDPDQSPAARAARIDGMLAMTITERLHWLGAWSNFVREAEERGEDVYELVYGKSSSS